MGERDSEKHLRGLISDICMHVVVCEQQAMSAQHRMGEGSRMGPAVTDHAGSPWALFLSLIILFTHLQTPRQP